jgi:hypothetical protein
MNLNIWGVAIVVAILLSAPGAAQQTMTLTHYDDGLACPGGCDAHVVFRGVHNGTKNAFAPPMSNRALPAPPKCDAGRVCVICFGVVDTTCMETVYQGSGPPAGRFDVTPALLEKHCADPAAPKSIADKSRALENAAKKFDGKINCLREPGKVECAAVVKAARDAHAADKPEYAACQKIGAKAYNKTQADPLKHRSIMAGCAYAQNLREQNSKGHTWQRLMPGACRPGTFVGRWGTDCCTGLALTDAAYGGGECASFYR